MTLLQRILEAQFKMHKDVKVQDMYKLLYQGTFGSEHMLNEKSREIFYEEFEKAEPNKEEIMIERISPTFFLYRLNIRPYKFYNGEKETLFEWFYESSKIKEGRVQDFLTFWNVFKGINQEKNYFLPKEIQDFEKKYIEQKQIPVMHHSEQYKKANNPSYRVVNDISLYCRMKNQ